MPGTCQEDIRNLEQVKISAREISHSFHHPDLRSTLSYGLHR